MTPDQLIQFFSIEGQPGEIRSISSGHINDTFRICNAVQEAPDYLLQRINHQVFNEVEAMMDNIRKVTEHIKSKPDSQFTSLTIIPARNGRLFHLTDEGNYWRVYDFQKDLLSFDVAETPEQIYEGAKAFGAFLRDLSDLPASEIFPTLPNFHHVPWRVGNLQKAKAEDAAGRLASAKSMVQYALSIAGEMSRIQQLGDQRRLPLRITHNDTKFNNVLLDQQGHGRCVIDLDTVMPGYVHFDFGDGIRTCVSSAPEDESDLQNIEVDLDRFRAFACGYLELTRDILTPLELEYLPLSGAMLAYIMGIRFLTDFLMGDVYYKIHYPEQNLQRANAQLELTRKLLERMGEMRDLLDC